MLPPEIKSHETLLPSSIYAAQSPSAVSLLKVTQKKHYCKETYYFLIQI